jgi:hypothetical protein
MEPSATFQRLPRSGFRHLLHACLAGLILASIMILLVGMLFFVLITAAAWETSRKVQMTLNPNLSSLIISRSFSWAITFVHHIRLWRCTMFTWPGSNTITATLFLVELITFGTSTSYAIKLRAIFEDGSVESIQGNTTTDLIKLVLVEGSWRTVYIWLPAIAFFMSVLTTLFHFCLQVFYRMYGFKVPYDYEPTISGRMFKEDVAAQRGLFEGLDIILRDLTPVGRLQSAFRRQRSMDSADSCQRQVSLQTVSMKGR